MGLTCSHLGTRPLDRARGNEQWCTFCGSPGGTQPLRGKPTSSLSDDDTPLQAGSRMLRQGWASPLQHSNRTHTKPVAKHRNVQWWRMSACPSATIQAVECVLYQTLKPAAGSPLMRTGRKQAVNLHVPPHPPLSLWDIWNTDLKFFALQGLQVSSSIN